MNAVMSKPTRAARKKYPKHAVTHQVVEAAIEVSDALFARLHATLDACCELRETLRLQREANRDEARRLTAAGFTPQYLTQNDQYRFISGLVAHDRRYAGVHSQVLQDVADRVHKGTQAWLKDLKKPAGKKRGPLRPVARKRYRSFTFTQYGMAVKIRHGRLFMSKLGDARLLGLRKLPGRVKNVTLVWKHGRWFAQLCCEVQVQHQPRRTAAEVAHLPDTGADTGLARNATLADGTTFAPSKPLQKTLPRLRTEQKKLGRQFEARKQAFAAYKAGFKASGQHGPLPKKCHWPLSNRLKRQIRRVAVLHSKVVCQRRDQLRKIACYLEQRYRLVAVEDHGLEFMTRNRRLARAVADVAPGMFKRMLAHALGERYVPVPNKRPGIGGNSQTCICGEPVPKGLGERWHDCPKCGLSADRDVVSANIAMDIAFGYCDLKSSASGQEVVRRGAGKEAGANALGLGWAPQARTAEPATKRHPPAERRSARRTTGGQPTVAVKNPHGLHGASAPSLPG